ncbi:nucleotide disphospho-sugar-binding domain-containing protein [Streptosporangium canum]|uniref:nucleotide disphospho-sugar-binding domain-containing protein n=1 Tax=Streptosporangium canum TaxID=324952 RepID=UPI0037BB9550
MRILFTAWAWPSHLYAMVPVAWACRAAGHDVLVASQPELTDAISRTGLPGASVGRDVDAVATFRDIVLPPPGRQPGAGGPRVLGLLTALAEAMVDDLVELGRNWRADLIVFEPTAFAGPLAAAALGIPAVRHLYGTDLMSVVGRFLPDALGPLSGKLGLDTVDPFGVATVDPCPARLQVPVGSRRLPVRYVPHNGPGMLPPEPPEPSGRPRVCVTWGTTLSRVDPGLFLAGQAVRAISALEVDVVVAVTPGQRALLGPLPPEVRVAESAPLHLLLPTCDAVVAHGGAGTLLTAVAYGLPQLLLPRLPDHVRHAGRLAEAGAGVVLAAPVEDPAAISDRLAELLATPAYRAAAEELRQEMRGRPSPAQVVRELELLATGAVRP